MCAFKRIENCDQNYHGLDIWVGLKMVSRGNRHLVTTYASTHLKQLLGLKKRSAPDCSDYATSSTMAMCCYVTSSTMAMCTSRCRVVTPPILLACPITPIIGTLPQISTTPLIRGDGYHGTPLTDLLFSCQPFAFLLPLQ